MHSNVLHEEKEFRKSISVVSARTTIDPTSVSYYYHGVVEAFV
jgi:hypothetical protein